MDKYHKDAVKAGKQWAHDLAKAELQGRDEKVIRAARKRLIEEVEDWSKTGKSVKQLIFRLKTVHVEPPSREIT